MWQKHWTSTILSLTQLQTVTPLHFIDQTTNGWIVEIINRLINNENNGGGSSTIYSVFISNPQHIEVYSQFNVHTLFFFFWLHSGFSGFFSLDFYSLGWNFYSNWFTSRGRHVSPVPVQEEAEASLRCRRSAALHLFSDEVQKEEVKEWIQSVQ